MFELPPLLLGLAFILVGFAAWYLGRRNGAARTVRLPRDYYVGLDHLINDRFDHAAEIFARMAEADGDAAEIQFALGSLFRRRGEVDRAIAIHSRLREQEGAGLADKAAFALALDYQSAGLMDRAERVLEELAASREYRNIALDQLVGIYETQGDWAKALKVFHELPASVQAERGRVAAHYLCELAEHALVQGEASARVRCCARPAVTRRICRAPTSSTARIAEQAGDSPGALLLYLKALETSPGLALEIIPAVLIIARRTGSASAINELGGRLRHGGRVTPRQLAWLLATAAPPEDETLLPQVAGELGGGVQSAAEASSLSALLTRIGDAGGRYQCDDCGLNSVGWYWRCPKCRGWDSMRPAVFKWAERADHAGRRKLMRTSSKSVIRTAVFPVAGRGTRFLPATKASPKEMLPVVDKPLIQYAVEEALAAGARRLVFITGASKRAIEDHFDSDSGTRGPARPQGKSDLVNQLRSVLPSYASCIYIRQSAPLGLGHAVLCAQPAVGAEPFFVHLADDLIRSEVALSGADGRGL